MKTLLLIGIGAGHPDHLTQQAARAMRRVDVFFLLNKEGAGKDALIAARRAMLDRAVPDGAYRIVSATSPERVVDDRDYAASIDGWRGARSDLVEDLIVRHLRDGETAGLLIWGDPCLYDGTIGILHDLVAGGHDLAFEVIPGISSVQALTAAHRLPLNRVGESITVTTGRQLARMQAAAIGNVVVMLDGQAAFQRFRDSDLDIYWGAYLGTEDEILAAGPLCHRSDEIARIIAEQRARHGWIMDTYLLRRPRLSGADKTPGNR